MLDRPFPDDPTTKPSSGDLLARIDTARSRSLAWLRSLQVEGLPHCVMRISQAHDAGQWPGVLLPGTYNGIMCLDLLGGLDDMDRAARGQLVAWLENHRRADGVFRIPGMNDDNVYKKPDRDETWRYIDFHVTNYSLGAIEALEPTRAPHLAFVTPFLNTLILKAWLSDRDMRDPWQEGNNIVNLAGFLMLLKRFGDHEHARKVDDALAVMIDWHDRNQDPGTGFWGVGQGFDALQLLHAMAGSMHNFHIWYALGRPLPYQDKAVDYVLARPTDIHSACIDVDEIDLLIHADAMIGHRSREIRAWLEAKLVALLDFQNEDGGFADVTTGVRRQDGWVGGYSEPQGLSNTFATWFRWIAIAMAADALWPGQRTWNFRGSIGIGYRMPMPHKGARSA